MRLQESSRLQMSTFEIHLIFLVIYECLIDEFYSLQLFHSRECCPIGSLLGETNEIKTIILSLRSNLCYSNNSISVIWCYVQN